jgi:hypothetical protein
VGLNGLLTDCAVASPIPTRAPTQHPTAFGSEVGFTLSTEEEEVIDRLLINFDAPALGGGDKGCFAIATSGKLTGLNLRMDFMGGRSGSSWASDILLSLVDSQACVDIGGNSIDSEFWTCDTFYLWPSSMNNNQNGAYAAWVDLNRDDVVRQYEDRLVSCF